MEINHKCTYLYVLIQKSLKLFHSPVLLHAQTFNSYK